MNDLIQPVGSPGYIGALKALLHKDFLLERRGYERLAVTAGFALLVVVLFHFAFDIQPGEGTRFFPGAVWVALFFSGTLGMARSGQAATNDGETIGLLLAPIDRSAVFLAKFIVHLTMMIVVELVVVPMLIASFGLRHIENIPMLLLSLSLGTWGLVVLGTLLGGMIGGTSASGLLLPLLLFPLLVPVALGATALTTSAVTGDLTDVTWAWVRTLLVFNIVFTVIPLLFYEYMLEV